MNFDVNDRTILLVKHGSQAYGTNTPTSDLDIKGVCIEPMSHQLGFLNTFEQFEQMGKNVGGNLAKLKAVKGKDADIVVYSLKKFGCLASNCNPNIIEVLHVDESDIIFKDEFGERLRERKYDFLSRKAKFTFSGYAHAQLKRIKTHRAWLLDPPKQPPARSEFGLSEDTKVSKSELGAFDAYTGGDIQIVTSLSSKLPSNVMELFTLEKKYQQAMLHWEQYQTWLKQRNPARAELEAKYGYDTKHGMHLLRLMRMCKEILLDGKVNVKRPDADELRAIRFGSVSYDQLIEQAEQLESECEVLYQTSSLQKEPDRVALDKFIVDLTLDYVKQKGY